MNYMIECFNADSRRRSLQQQHDAGNRRSCWFQCRLTSAVPATFHLGCSQLVRHGRFNADSRRRSLQLSLQTKRSRCAWLFQCRLTSAVPATRRRHRFNRCRHSFQCRLTSAVPATRLRVTARPRQAEVSMPTHVGGPCNFRQFGAASSFERLFQCRLTSAVPATQLAESLGISKARFQCRLTSAVPATKSTTISPGTNACRFQCRLTSAVPATKTSRPTTALRPRCFNADSRRRSLQRLSIPGSDLLGAFQCRLTSAVPATSLWVWMASWQCRFNADSRRRSLQL